jgi:hypothetical protein
MNTPGQALSLLVAQTGAGSWHVDFANTAWGAIVAAIVSATIGILLKAVADRNLAKAQGEITKNVQDHVLEKQSIEQKKMQLEIQDKQAELQRVLAELQSKLSDANNSASARRAYEYEARKRLYADIEPLLFQIYEGLEEAHHRVRSLARSDRAGNLGATGWLSKKGYYLRSTSYKLLVPVAHLRLLQRCMTFVDVALDPQIYLRYRLLKLYVRSFTDDFDLANLTGLVYDPDDRSNAVPAQRARQGLLVGTIENLAEAMIVSGNGKARACSLAEFEALLNATPRNQDVDYGVNLFLGFSPVERPVLACVLTAQACLARLILSTYHGTAAAGALESLLLTEVLEDQEMLDALRWAQGSERELMAARAYLVEGLQTLARELAARVPRRERRADDV